MKRTALVLFFALIAMTAMYAQSTVTVYGFIYWVGGECGNYEPYTGSFTVTLKSDDAVITIATVNAIQGYVTAPPIPLPNNSPSPNNAIITIGVNSRPVIVNITNNLLFLDHIVVWMNTGTSGVTNPIFKDQY